MIAVQVVEVVTMVTAEVEVATPTIVPTPHPLPPCTPREGVATPPGPTAVLMGAGTGVEGAEAMAQGVGLMDQEGAGATEVEEVIVEGAEATEEGVGLMDLEGVGVGMEEGEEAMVVGAGVDMGVQVDTAGVGMVGIEGEGEEGGGVGEEDTEEAVAMDDTELSKVQNMLITLPYCFC